MIGNNTRSIRCDYGTDQTWDAPSDARMKNVMHESKLGLEFIKRLKPTVYKWKPPSEWPKEFGVRPDADMNTTDPFLGMIAQDVKAALDAAGNPTFGGWTEVSTGQQQLGESAFVYPLISAVKELAAKVAMLEARA